MTKQCYRSIEATRAEFHGLVEKWSDECPYLLEAQERVREEKGYDDYLVETSVVYNRALDDISEDWDEIKVVLVADNPGKKEQLAENNRYLVGQSGKLAERWFRRELGMDFRREVLILNKTPIHTPKTAELKLLKKHSGPHRAELEVLLAESQKAMAELAWRLYVALCDAKRPGASKKAGANGSGAAGDAPWPVIWISGVGELRDGGLFEVYRDALCDRMRRAKAAQLDGVWAFNHFSMNQFAIELKNKAKPGARLEGELERIGRENRLRVFGL
jgi:hypothetical protein